jgi:hypothetical protein
VEIVDRDRPGGGADDVATGSSAPPDRRRGRSRTPRESRRSAVADTSCTRETIVGFGDRHAPVSKRRDDRESAGSSRQAGAALGATALDDGATTTGTHACAKSVLLGTAVIVGLECTLHVASSITVRTSALRSRSLVHDDADSGASYRPDKATGTDTPLPTIRTDTSPTSNRTDVSIAGLHRTPASDACIGRRDRVSGPDDTTRRPPPSTPPDPTSAAAAAVTEPVPGSTRYGGPMHSIRRSP